MKTDVFLNDIYDIVNNYNKRGSTRFHMPGHKGVGIGSFLDPVLPLDLTELDDTDNMLDSNPGGAVETTEKLAERLFGSSCTVISCGGATLALQTAIMSVLRVSESKTVICDRKAHKSVVNALALSGGDPVWFDPAYPPKILPSAAAMIVTSPNYYGELLDLSTLSALAHSYKMPIICDNSHGSHLAFSSCGLHPLRCGADFSVDSIHKTLPALTGCALLHTSCGCFTREKLKSAMRLFASTSPSYLLGASVALCLRYLECEGISAVAKTEAQVKDSIERLRALGYTLRGGNLYDPSRLCLRLKNADRLYKYLYQNNVVCEFADSENLVLIPSPMNNETDYERMITLCTDWARSNIIEAPVERRIKLPYPESVIPLREAVLSDFTVLPLKDADGEICAAPAAPYPPGIPLIMPGERFNSSVIDTLEAYGFEQVTVVKQNHKTKL